MAARFSFTHDPVGWLTGAYAFDEAGRVTELESAAPPVTYSYDPWGTLLPSSETVPNPCRYDTTTGLYFWAACLCRRHRLGQADTRVHDH
ncbi:MAG: hypothetical protein ABFC80_07365 [Coriobacteriales bacterium]